MTKRITIYIASWSDSIRYRPGSFNNLFGSQSNVNDLYFRKKFRMVVGRQYILEYTTRKRKGFFCCEKINKTMQASDCRAFRIGKHYAMHICTEELAKRFERIPSAIYIRVRRKS